MIKAISAIYDTKLTHRQWTVEGLPWLKIGSIIGGRGEDYDLRSVSRNSDLCTAFVAISTVPRSHKRSFGVQGFSTRTAIFGSPYCRAWCRGAGQPAL